MTNFLRLHPFSPFPLIHQVSSMPPLLPPRRSQSHPSLLIHLKGHSRSMRSNQLSFLMDLKTKSEMHSQRNQVLISSSFNSNNSSFSSLVFFFFPDRNNYFLWERMKEYKGMQKKQAHKGPTRERPPRNNVTKCIITKSLRNWSLKRRNFTED